MTAAICGICGKGKVQTHEGTYETQYRDRDGNVQELLVPNVTWQECDECHEGFLDDAAVQTIEAARRDAMHLLSPAEIKTLRDQHRKTQKEISRLLGIGEKTYCRWESGGYVQSLAFDRYLRLLIEIPENIHVLERIEFGQNAVRRNHLTFEYLEDIDVLEPAAEMFTDALESGTLYAARA